jgi:hypothetical protein
MHAEWPFWHATEQRSDAVFVGLVDVEAVAGLGQQHLDACRVAEIARIEKRCPTIVVSLS